MNLKTILSAAAFLVCFAPMCVLAESPRQISIQVVDESGKAVEGAEVRVRYLATVKHGGEEQHGGDEYRVPMELAAVQKTDKSGHCTLELSDVAWSLAAIQAHRAGLSSEERDKLYDNAPQEPEEFEAFEREVTNRSQRFVTAFHMLTPDLDTSAPITLKMTKAIKVTGRVRIDGNPVEKALLTISSPKTQIDQFFPLASTVLTDREGRFEFYSIPGKLDRASILFVRSDGNRVLNLTDVNGKQTPTGLVYEFDTNARDYAAE